MPQIIIEQYHSSLYIANRSIVSNHLFSISKNLELFTKTLNRLDDIFGILLLEKRFLFEVNQDQDQDYIKYWEEKSKKDLILRNLTDLQKCKIHAMTLNIDGYTINPILNFNMVVTFWIEGFLPSLSHKVTMPMLDLIHMTNFGSLSNIGFLKTILLNLNNKKKLPFFLFLKFFIILLQK